jgi:peptidyl-prolyl cis-trans isomerase C
MVGFLPACSEREALNAPTDSQALATVNGHVITVRDFQTKWSELPGFIQAVYSHEDGRKELLNELINRELLLQEAMRRKIDQKPAFADQVEKFRERMLLDAMLQEEVENRIAVSEEELSAYFKAHKDKLPPIEEVRAQHILVKSDALARDLLKRLARGESFARLAKAYSQDSGTKDHGGNLGAIRRGQTRPEFEAALFSLKPGQISDVVKTPSGYHIVRVQDRRRVKPLHLQEARDEVRREVIKEKERRYFEELVGGLRAKASIQVMEPVLAALEMPDAGPTQPASP